MLRLELKVLADVGLLGMPNAGKSTFLSAVSQARPKIADYPFTTLYPQLGVVYIGHSSSFVIADIPGLIEGAASGTGLGTRFLRHLGRTRILLHMVDIMPLDEKNLAESVHEIESELEKYDETLAAMERWLVLNKVDTIATGQAREVEQELVEKITWTAPVYRISAVTGEGCKKLTNDIMARLAEMDEQLNDDQVEAVESAVVSP